MFFRLKREDMIWIWKVFRVLISSQSLQGFLDQNFTSGQAWK